MEMCSDEKGRTYFSFYITEIRKYWDVIDTEKPNYSHKKCLCTEYYCCVKPQGCIKNVPEIKLTSMKVMEGKSKSEIEDPQTSTSP